MSHFSIPHDYLLINYMDRVLETRKTVKQAMPILLQMILILFWKTITHPHEVTYVDVQRHSHHSLPLSPLPRPLVLIASTPVWSLVTWENLKGGKNGPEIGQAGVGWQQGGLPEGRGGVRAPLELSREGLRTYL